MTEFRPIAASLAILVLLGACGNEKTVLRCDDSQLGIEDVLTQARRPVYDSLRDHPGELIDAVIRNNVVRHAVTRKPLSPEETRRLEEIRRHRSRSRCVALGIKRRLASGEDLDTVARRRFETDPAAFTLPESFQLQMIFLPADIPDAGGLAGRLLDEVSRNPDAFPELARRYSRSETSSSGGMTRPMPGSAVHPEMRKAIAKHKDSRAPFLLSIDRGFYVLRILEYWPPVEGNYEEIATIARKKVAAELVEEEYREIAREIGVKHSFAMDDAVFFDPAVRMDRVVMNVDGDPVTAGEILGEPGKDDTVAGPLLREEAEAYRRSRMAALFFSCRDEAPSPATADEIIALRLGDVLAGYTSRKMKTALKEYCRLHRDVLQTDPRWNFDLWVLPRKSEDPYRDLREYDAVSTALHAGASPGSDVLKEAGVISFRGLELTEGRILQYEPRLLQILKKLGDNDSSTIIRSIRLHAFLVIRRHGFIEGRPLGLDLPEDRRAVVRHFIESNREDVMDSYFNEVVSDCRINRDLVEECVSRLEAGVSGGGSR